MRSRPIVLLAFLAAAAPAAAESYLADSSVVIEERRSFESRLPLRSPGQAGWGLMLFARPERAPSGLVHYERLPGCTGSEVRRQEIYNHTEGTKVFDVLYYSAEDPEQARLAKAYRGHARPYREALLRKADGHPDFWQHFARFAEVRCLPTRYHFVTRGGRRYLELRSGDAAWE